MSIKLDKDNLTENIKGLIDIYGKKYLTKWSRDHPVNLLSIAHLAMTVVEELTQDQAKNGTFVLSGDEKYKLAKAFIPQLIQTLEDNTVISRQQAETFKEKFDQGTDLINETITVAIDIANNPHFIQATNAIVEFIDDKFSKKDCCNIL